MDPSPTLPPFDELPGPFEVLGRVISILERLGIPYVVAGSLVSSFYGPARNTQDVDLVVDLTENQVSEVVEAFRQEFFVDAGQVSQAVTRRSSFNIIHFATSLKIDLFLLKDRPFDRESFARRQFKVVDTPSGIQAFIQTPEDLVLSKLVWYELSGRVLQSQWLDIANVLKARADSLDGLYLRRWAAELGVAELLDRAFQEAGPARLGGDG